MEHNEYYDGLDPKELVYDLYLIFIIEAAAYCESYQTDRVKRARLKENCDQKLNELTKGERSNFGGSFGSIMISERYTVFFTVSRVENKKDTWIYPNIPTIQEEVKRRKTENLKYGNNNDRLVRLIKGDTVNHHRCIDEPPIEISEYRVSLEVKRRVLV